MKKKIKINYDELNDCISWLYIHTEPSEKSEECCEKLRIAVKQLKTLDNQNKKM